MQGYFAVVDVVAAKVKCFSTKLLKIQQFDSAWLSTFTKINPLFSFLSISLARCVAPSVSISIPFFCVYSFTRLFRMLKEKCVRIKSFCFFFLAMSLKLLFHWIMARNDNITTRTSRKKARKIIKGKIKLTERKLALERKWHRGMSTKYKFEYRARKTEFMRFCCPLLPAATASTPLSFSVSRSPSLVS